MTMAIPRDPTGPPPTSDGKLLRITLYIKKLPSITDEYFHAYWANNHVAPARANAKFRQNIVRYVQHHISPKDRALAGSLGLPVLDYDGVAEIWVRNLQDYLDAVTDRDLSQQLEGDDQRFIQQPVQLTMGYDHVVIGGPVSKL